MARPARGGARRVRRVSTLFGLGRSQPSLDFVDVDVNGDTPLFISPSAVSRLPTTWGHECTSLIQNFFSRVLELIKDGDDAGAERLLSALREPNETHLGMSRGRSRGRALGDGSAHDVWASLRNSAAARSGLISDLEDTALLIPGIGLDIISDMTTNIIRGPLITYTQEQCRDHGIPMRIGMASGPIWDPQARAWTEHHVELPVADGMRLLLVPKSVVRQSLLYNLSRYYHHHLLSHLQRVEFEANTALVRVAKDGTRELPFKTKVKEKYGSSKEDIVRETIKAPDVIEEYKREQRAKPYHPLAHEQIAEVGGSAMPDWRAMLERVREIPTGRKHATDYEKAVESLLTALLYPDSIHPVMQSEIHDGRKRIDIQYDNMASAGFFQWLSRHYPSALIFVECKNYGGEVANPELDQLAGRFSPGRGQVGLLVVRHFDDKQRFQDRCRDTARDQRGYIIALDDADLAELVDARINDAEYRNWALLRERFQRLIA